MITENESAESSEQAGSGEERPAEDAALEPALRMALEAGGLSVVYQPLVRSGDGHILGVEALLRWDRPPSGPIAPSTFIPLAERSGLMPRIGAWVLRSSLEQLGRWHSAGLAGELLLHVNLSLPELLDPGLPRTVGAILVDSGVEPPSLCLEVTEPILRRGGAAAESALAGLRRLGVRLVLDDFGTSSSIEALTRYEFDYAKVDRSLIGGLDSSAHRARLVRGLLGMAKALGTTVIAEGVEHNDEIDRIAALGIVKVQGYATGRPVSAAELERAFGGERSWGHPLAY